MPCSKKWKACGTTSSAMPGKTRNGVPHTGASRARPRRGKHPNMEHHLRDHAAAAFPLRMSGTPRTFAETRFRKNWFASAEKPSPHFGCDHHEACTSPVAGQLWTFSVLVPEQRHPGAWRLAVPSALMGDTKVVSIASWAPRHKGSPSAMISSRRPSNWSNTPRVEVAHHDVGADSGASPRGNPIG